MTDSELPSIDPEDDPETQKEKLRQATEQRKQTRDAQHAAMLNAVAGGEDGIDVGEYEWVQIGEVDILVKTFIPGKSLNTIQKAQRLASRENVDAALDSIYTMTEALTVVTERIEYDETTVEQNEQIRDFWEGMFEKWGVEGFQSAADTALEPASEDMEAKADAAEGFRSNR